LGSNDHPIKTNKKNHSHIYDNDIFYCRSLILQEVSFTIFNNSCCAKAYISPPVPRRNYPEGAIDTFMIMLCFIAGGDRSPILQEVSITIFNNSYCAKAYTSPPVPRRNYPEGIIASQMCAGDPNGGRDACQVCKGICTT
jgi:hypothetical protein